MNIIKPQKLKKGDTVGVISPSSYITKDLRGQFESGIKRLESYGLKVRAGKHVLDQYFYSAGTREDRIEDFNTIWADPEVKMVLMSIGGETANHILDSIDYEMIKKNPKIFAGISDGTTLLNAIYAKTGLVTYHGPDLIFTFGRKMTKPYKDNFIKTLFEGNVGQLFPDPNWEHQEDKSIKPRGWRCIRSGKANGVLVGGHSSCLSNIMLAGYVPSLEGTILFLEGTHPVANLDKQLTTLRLNGTFDKINGLIIGWFEWSEMENKSENREVAEMVLEVTKDYSFPILEIEELGHNVENYIFPIGCKATMNADQRYLSIDEQTVL